MSIRSPIPVFRLAVCLAAVCVLNACSTRSLPETAQRCTEPRPQICTAIYDPVCAYRIQPGASPTTYASGCNACADPAVAGFTPGACAD